MAATNHTPIILYNSSTTGSAPIAAKLASGEVAINTFDGLLFYKDPSNNIKSISSGVSKGQAIAYSLIFGF
jgi:hypothetical protein